MKRDIMKRQRKEKKLNKKKKKKERRIELTHCGSNHGRKDTQNTRER